ncbi:FKBP-type peptidyl-prolyl cis-trans isomerase SlpA [uncultured Candidatus Thioglobus sp.]|nr:FKBP-type peptidyl-prolyl cis-trans isomerase SlpA [uncultured Candidatus Thioglobus sp.]
MPLTFEIGDGQLDPCLESCVKSAKINTLQTFLLGSDEAFGQPLDEAFQTMKRDEFPKDMDIKLNNGVEFTTPTNDSYVGRIDKIDGEKITVDFNHPLAGADVSFQVKVIEKL